MSNTTTWVFDGEDKLSAVFSKIKSNMDAAFGSAKKAVEAATKPVQDIHQKIQAVTKPLDDVKAKISGSFNPSAVKETTSAVGELKEQLEDLNKTPVDISENTGLSGFKGALGSVGKTMAGLFVASNVQSFTSSVIDITAEFQKYEAVLTNTFKSTEKARQSMQMIQDFAANTPYQVNELTDSYIKLVNRGFTPTYNEMTYLGDLAATTGKSFDQLTEAVLDAQTGEFERLKDFGVKASSEGDKVSLSFKGVTETVAKTPDAIKDALLRFGQMDGVAGTMESISNTIEGRISNLQDTYNQFKLSLGQAFTPAITTVINAMSGAVELLKKHSDIVADVIKSVVAGVTGAGIAFAAYTVYTNIATISSFTFAGALQAVRTAMLANPFTAIAVGISAAVFALMQAWKKFEGFRAFVMGMWEVIKTVFSSMWDVVKQFFGGLGKVIEGAKTLDFGMIKEGVSDSIGAALTATPVGMAVHTANSLGKYKDAYHTGAEKGRESFRADQNKAATPEDVVKDEKSKTPLATLPAGNSSGGSSGGGSSVRNVSVKIQQLVGSINIHTTNLNESVNSIKEKVTEALISSVRDSEIAMS